MELYHAVREVDSKHIIALHGHNSEDQTQSWGDPKKLGLTNVVFEVHPYPGLFGWGAQDYETHRDWLTCGEDGNSGICEWRSQFELQDTPVLLGEIQPWAGLGELGGEIARASFDIYNDMGWAATAWSYRVHTKSGGAPNGEWGYVTNAPVNSNGDTVRQIAKAESWTCDDWESTFENACSKPAFSSVLHHDAGQKTMYLVVKAGSDTDLDLLLDDIQLTHDKTGNTLLTNGDFEAGTASWSFAAFDSEVSPDYEVVDAGDFAGTDSDMALRLYSADDARRNGFLYQQISAVGGESYTLSGKFKEQGSDLAWAEIYVVDAEPADGMADITPLNFGIDINSADLIDIQTFFDNLATMPLEVNPWVREKLAADERSTVFTNIPGNAEALSIQVNGKMISLDWYAPFDDVDHYSVYRSNRKTYGYSVVSTTSDTRYSETVNDAESNTYYYYVVAHTGLDQSRASNVVASGDGAIAIPNIIEAEGYLDAEGIKVDLKSGNSSASFIGSFDQYDWVEYLISVPTSGSYDLTYAWATSDENATDSDFELYIDGQFDSVLPYMTSGSWNQFATGKVSIDLEAGKHTLRLINGSPTWVNFDYLQFTVPPQPYSALSRIEAEAFWANSGVVVSNDIDSASNEEYVGSFDVDDWLEFDMSVPTTGTYYLTYSWATQADPGELSFSVDGASAATLSIENSGGWNVFDTETVPVNLTEGTRTVRISNVDVQWVNFDYIELSSTEPVVVIPAVVLPAKLEAEDYVDMQGVSDGGPSGNSSDLFVGDFHPGDWVEFKVEAPSTGTYYINYAWATGAAPGSFAISSDGNALGNLAVSTTANWDAFETAEQMVTLNAGVQTLRVTNTDVDWVNLDYLTVTVQPVSSVPAILEAENFFLQDGLSVEPQSGNSVGAFVGGFDVDDWIEFRIDVPATGDYLLSYNFATGSSGSMDVYVDGYKTNTLNIVNSGDWNKFRSYSQVISLSAGIQDIRISNASVGWVNFDSIELQNYTPLASGYTLPMNVSADDGDLRSEGDRLRLDGSVAKDFDAGDWYEFDVDVSSTTNYTLTLNLNAWDDGNVSIFVNGIKVADLSIGDGDADFADHSTTFDLTAGYSTVRLVFDTLNWADVANFKLN
jgi:hypothetical protein